MPDFLINGEPVSAPSDQTVLEAALEHGFFVPYFCWHPELSTAGNCRMCLVEVEGRGLDIACNMPITAGMRVLTDSDEVKAHRKAMLQFITLNHPVDCGICDKAGECRLQDYHHSYSGETSKSIDPKVRSTKFYDLSDRIVLDNERCILCLRCTRFTHEISKSMSLGVERRGDVSNVRPVEGQPLAEDPYSDNLIDLCPVGALLSRQFMYQSRVWYLEATPSVCPGCARGCNIQIWHRKAEWQHHSVDKQKNAAIARVTPLENAAVNGPWICNKGRDLANIFERRRADGAMLKGQSVPLTAAVDAARSLIANAKHAHALISSWASTEELVSFRTFLSGKFVSAVKQDCIPQPGERIEDDLLVLADKNPNTTAARALFGDAPIAFSGKVDLLLVWGEGCDFSTLPRHVPIIFLNSYLRPENGYADVFLPISVQTERDGHYTNFAGRPSAFRQCFQKGAGVIDAEVLFALLATPVGAAG